MNDYYVDDFYVYYRGWRLDRWMFRTEAALNRALDEIDRLLARRYYRTTLR